MLEVVVMKVVVVDYRDGDWKACVDDECIETEGYCDSLHGAHIVDDTVIDEEEFEDWRDKVWKSIQRVLKSKEDISVSIIHRPLGRCYGNSYWHDIDFEHLSGDTWKLSVSRGSNTWGRWIDIGMTGTKTDYTTYVSEDTVESFLEDFVDDPQSFLDMDVNEWINDVRSKVVEYSLYEVDSDVMEEFMDMVHEYDADSGVMAVVEIWDSDGWEHELANTLWELSDGDRIKFMRFIEKLKDDYEVINDEQFNNAKAGIESAKTLGDILRVFEKYVFVY